jgi:ESS family glutamate:Na+ symporter
LSINLPAFSVTKNNPALFGWAIVISGVYLLASIISYLIIAKKRAFINPKTYFYTED